jgi:hypothetical protein
MFSKRSGNFNRNAFKAKIKGKHMAEWLYKQKVDEVKEQHKDFTLKAAHELMRKLSDIEDEGKIDSYNAITDLRLELTAKAHGQNLSAEEIRANDFLLTGVEKYADQVISPEVMRIYRSDSKDIRKIGNLIAEVGANLSPDTFVINGDSEDLIDYISNSAEYNSEASDAEKAKIAEITTIMIKKLINEDKHLEYLAVEANFERFENAVELAKAAGIIRAGEITLDNLLTGEINPRLPLEMIEGAE